MLRMVVVIYIYIYIYSAWWIHVTCLPTSFRVDSLALGQSYDCPGASEANPDALHWRHDERDDFSKSGVSIVCPTFCWGADQIKTPKLHVTGLCEGNPPVTGGFPLQNASNAENVSIWWRHHALLVTCTVMPSAFLITYYTRWQKAWSPLLWRHNEHDSVSYHQPRGCLLDRLFRRRSKKTSKLRVTGLCAGNSPGPVNSPHKGPVTRKMFPFDDVIMHSTGNQLPTHSIDWLSHVSLSNEVIFCHDPVSPNIFHFWLEFLANLVSAPVKNSLCKSYAHGSTALLLWHMINKMIQWSWI